MEFYEKRAEFPLFLDDPNNRSCRFICQNSTINETLYTYMSFIMKTYMSLYEFYISFK
ncbi:hypothetical protein Hanom_Chr01g00020781 [Helianthus anomalus]